jgi:hypothetical protein
MALIALPVARLSLLMALTGLPAARLSPPMALSVLPVARLSLLMALTAPWDGAWHDGAILGTKKNPPRRVFQGPD